MSGGFWAFIGKMSTALFAVGINAILARMLTPAEMGVYFLAFNVVMLGSTIGTLGLTQTLVRYIASNVGLRNKRNIFYTIRLSFLLAFASSLLIGVFYYYTGGWIARNVFDSGEMAAISLLIAIWIGVNIFQRLLAESFRGFQDIKFAAMFGGFISSILFIGSLLFISKYGWIQINLSSTLMLMIVALIVSCLAGTLFLGKQLQTIRKQFNDEQADDQQALTSKTILYTTIPLLVVNISLFVLNQSDLWIIGAVRGQEEVAIYGAAAKLVTIIGMPLIILNAVVPPMIAEKHAQGKLEQLEQMLRMGATGAGFPALVILLSFIFFGPGILSVVFGDFYSSGWVVLMILGFKQLIIVWNGACGTILMMTGRQKLLMVITIISGSLSIALSLFLGRIYGAAGVAIGYLIPNAMAQILMWIFVRRAYSIRADVDLWGTASKVKGLYQHHVSKNVS